MSSHHIGFLAAVLLMVPALSGCVSATKSVRNENATIQKYSDVYLIPPKEDPRNVVPKVVEQFKAMGLNVKVVDGSKALEGAQGTGFLITDAGHILTCAHVLGDETTATVWLSGVRYEADVLSKDKDRDVALLKVRGNLAPVTRGLSFRSDRHYGIGADVFTIGFPLSSVLGNSARFTKGSISSTNGLKDDPKQLQISAEIQPGNSGGPLLDKDGVVVGLIQQTLSPLNTLARTGGAERSTASCVRAHHRRSAIERSRAHRSGGASVRTVQRDVDRPSGRRVGPRPGRCAPLRDRHLPEAT